MHKSNFALTAALLVCLGCSNDRPESSRSPNLDRAAAMREELVTRAVAEVDTAAAEAEPTDYVTLTGVVTLEGDVPEPGFLKFDKPECGKGATNPSLKVNSANKGIQDVLIYADRVPENWVHESAKVVTGEAVFDQEECIFLSQILPVHTSQTLLIKNSDGFGHNTKFDARGNDSLNLTIPGGGSETYQPDKEVNSPFEVSCTIHTWMKAHMIFREDAYFAVTDKDGTFEIANVPAGVPLQWKVWHQRAPSLKSVSVNGEATKLSRGAMTKAIEPSAANLDIVIAAAELQ